MRKRMVIFAFALSGAAALTYEVVWTRAFSLVVGSTTHALSTVLGAFMAGLALGAFLGARWLRERNPVRLLAGLEAATAAAGLLTLLVIRNLSPIYARFYYALHDQPSLFYVAQFAVVFAVVLVPTTLMGATFPAAVRAWTRSFESAAVDSGALYSVNTVGAVAGSLLAGFVLIPSLGLTWANATAAALNLAAAFLLGTFSLPQAGAVLLVAGAGLWANASTGTPQYAFNLYNANRIKSYAEYVAALPTFDVVWNHEDAEGDVQVTKAKSGPFYGLTVRGKPEGAFPSGDQPNQLLMTYLGAAYRPDAKSFLKIGLGPGVTLAAATQLANLERIDVIEINPSVTTAVSKFFFPELLKDPRVGVIAADARNHLAYDPRTYDIISSQSSDPTDAGSESLFTREYFEIVKARLAPNGVYVMYVPFLVLGQAGTESLMKTLVSVFAYVDEWDIKRGPPGVLAVASPYALAATSTVATHLGALAPEISDAYAFGAGTERVRKLLTRGAVPIVTDDRPALEFAAARTLLGHAKN